MDSALIAIVAAAIGGVFTLSGIALGSRLNSNRARKDKLWDLRRAAYGTILSEIGSIDRICVFSDAMMLENPIRYFDSKEREEYEKRIGKHWDVATRRFADDYLVLSDEFISVFEKLVADSEADEPNELWPEEQERFSNLMHAAKPQLIAQARSEVAEWGIGGYTLSGRLRTLFRRLRLGSLG